MPADQPRNRTVGSKMTDSEYEKLAAVAEQDGQTLGEWCREVLLERAEGRKPSAIEEALLAEVLALRSLFLNLQFRADKGPLSEAELRSLIERADGTKLERARERLQAARAASKELQAVFAIAIQCQILWRRLKRACLPKLVLKYAISRALAVGQLAEEMVNAECLHRPGHPGPGHGAGK